MIVGGAPDGEIAAGSTFTTVDLYPPVLDALGLPQSQYSLASLRYDLSKLRAKHPLENCPTRVAPVSPTRAIPSVCFSSSYSSASMLHSPPVSSRLSPAIATSP